jgi:hypothetical protein
MMIFLIIIGLCLGVLLSVKEFSRRGDLRPHNFRRASTVDSSDASPGGKAAAGSLVETGNHGALFSIRHLLISTNGALQKGLHSKAFLPEGRNFEPLQFQRD